MNPIAVVIALIWIVIIIVAIKAFLERNKPPTDNYMPSPDINASKAVDMQGKEKVDKVIAEEHNERAMITECPNCGKRFRVEGTPLPSEDYGVICQNCGWTFPVRPIPRKNWLTELIGIIVIGFLIAGAIWSFYEAIGGRFGWGASFLFLFGLVVAILVYFGKKSKEQ